MLRRGILLLLCLSLMLGQAALSEATPLSSEEMLSFRDWLYTKMQNSPVENDPQETYDPSVSETWLYAFSFGVAEVTGPTLDAEESSLVEVEIFTEEVACPRGIVVGDPLDKVLSSYLNENTQLAGNASYASLYGFEGDAENGWGWLLRRSQTVEGVEYTASIPAAGMEGYRQDITLLYIITDGIVSGIRASGFDALVPEEESRADLAAVREIAQLNAYVPSESDLMIGLSADDLQVNGISFVSASPEDCIAVLGTPMEDTMDSNQLVCTLTYADVLIESVQVEGTWKLAAILVSNGELSGPKGLHIGDTLESVKDRFGDGDAEDGLVYQCADEAGNLYALSCSFFGNALTEYLLYRL